MRRRAWTIALVGLVCLSILALLILWRSIASPPKSQSNDRQFDVVPTSHRSSPSGPFLRLIPPGTRIIRFPDRSLGRVYIRDWGSSIRWNSIVYSEAKGIVFIPPKTEVRLELHRQHDLDLSALKQLEPDDLQSLVFPPEKVFSIAVDEFRFIQELYSLRDLSLHSAKIGDIGIKYFGNLPALERLSLPHTDITDASITQMQGLRSLTLLDLSYTKITDVGLVGLRNLATLRHLNLESTKITDAGMPYLQSLPQLENLDISGTPVTNSGLLALHSLEALKRVRLDNHLITSEGISALKEALPNCRVDVRRVRLGPTPTPRVTHPIS